MRRAGIIAAGCVGLAAVAAAGIWLALRDTAEPVDVEEAVTSFRGETTGAAGASPIPEGVYVYRTDGYEKTDALTGVTHRYPTRSTITVAAAECGVRVTWRVLEGRSTEWTYCVTDDGLELWTQDERHTIFGSTQTTTYTCEQTPILPRDPSSGSWPVRCTTGDSDETGVARVVPATMLRVGDAAVPVRHVRKVTTFAGAIRGSARHDLWFHEQVGIPVGIVMKSNTTSDSLIGDVAYEEDVTLTLLSLEPRR